MRSAADAVNEMVADANAEKDAAEGVAAEIERTMARRARRAAG